MPQQGEITRLLRRWEAGDQRALQSIIPMVYRELKQMAYHYFQGEKIGHTLEPTALVNEAFLKLLAIKKPVFKNHHQFFGFAAEVMRRILLDYARIKKAEKRGGPAPKLSLDEALDIPLEALDPAQILSLNEMLNRLDQENDKGLKNIIELRFFFGYSYQEIAQILDIKTKRVENELAFAKRLLGTYID